MGHYHNQREDAFQDQLLFSRSIETVLVLDIYSELRQIYILGSILFR